MPQPSKEQFPDRSQILLKTRFLSSTPNYFNMPPLILVRNHRQDQHLVTTPANAVLCSAKSANRAASPPSHPSSIAAKINLLLLAPDLCSNTLPPTLTAHPSCQWSNAIAGTGMSGTIAELIFPRMKAITAGPYASKISRSRSSVGLLACYPSPTRRAT